MPVLRFYAELNDFLPPAMRGRGLDCAPAPQHSLKHLVESLGVPHTEVALVLVDGRPGSLREHVHGATRVAVFPAFRRLGPLAADGEVVVDSPPEPRFIADVHLARLARMLRFAGYDTLWRPDWQDAELAARARAEARIVLTRDRDLLMHRDVERGCHLRDAAPAAQLAELVRRLGLDLRGRLRAGRCLGCNLVLQPAGKAELAAGLPEGTREHFEHFWRCSGCGGVFWCGSHWKRMRATLDAAAGESDAVQRPHRAH